MSNKNILETINELNSNLDINPLFEFVTVMTIVKNKIKKEISDTKKPNLETLKKMTTFHEKIKNYIDAKLKTDEILDKEKCDLEAFDNLIKKIYEDDFDIKKISDDTVKNIYSCIYEHLSKLEKNILEQIKTNKENSQKKIKDLLIDKSISDKIELHDVKDRAKLKEIKKIVFERNKKYSLGHYCLMTKEIDEFIVFSQKIDEYNTKINEFENINKIVDNMNAYDTDKNNAIEAYSTIYEKEINMNKLYDETKDLNIEQSNTQSICITYDDIIKKIDSSMDYRLDEMKEIKEIVVKKYDEFKQINIDYSMIENFNKMYAVCVEGIKKIKEKIKELFNLVIIENKADEVEKIYDTFSEKSLTIIFNEFIKLLGDKTINFLYNLMQNVFSYLNKKQKFKYYSETINKDSSEKDISNDTDYTIVNLNDYITGNYDKREKKVKYSSRTIDGKTKIFQLFLIVLTKIVSAIVTHFYNKKIKNNNLVLETIKTIINDPDGLRKNTILGKIQYNKKDYTDAIKKKSGDRLYIENTELVGGNYYYSY